MKMVDVLQMTFPNTFLEWQLTQKAAILEPMLAEIYDAKWLYR